MTTKPKTTSLLALVLTGLILSSINMRSPIVIIGSTSAALQDALGLSTADIGYLGALPMPMFVMGALFAPSLARRFGLENMMISMTAVLALSIMGRVWLGTTGLFLGTFLLSLGIGMLNVLIAPFIKKHLPDNIALATGIFSLSMSISAGLIAWLVVPIMNITSWQLALSGWAIFSVLALGIWVVLKQQSDQQPVATPIQDIATTDTPVAHTIGSFSAWRSLPAWYMGVFFGIQSLMFYTLASFMPAIGMYYGLSLKHATELPLVFQTIAPLAIFLLTYLMKRGFSMPVFGVFCGLLNVIGSYGLAWQPSYLHLWAGMMGFGGAGIFTLMLMMFSVRTHNFENARDLSGTVQTIGYSLAFFGPLCLGWVSEWTGDWHTSLVILFGLMVINVFFGFFASQNSKIDPQISH